MGNAVIVQVWQSTGTVLAALLTWVVLMWLALEESSGMVFVVQGEVVSISSGKEAVIMRSRGGNIVDVYGASSILNFREMEKAKELTLNPDYKPLYVEHYRDLLLLSLMLFPQKLFTDVLVAVLTGIRQMFLFHVRNDQRALLFQQQVSQKLITCIGMIGFVFWPADRFVIQFSTLGLTYHEKALYLFSVSCASRMILIDYFHHLTLRNLVGKEVAAEAFSLVAVTLCYIFRFGKPLTFLLTIDAILKLIFCVATKLLVFRRKKQLVNKVRKFSRYLALISICCYVPSLFLCISYLPMNTIAQFVLLMVHFFLLLSNIFWYLLMRPVAMTGPVAVLENAFELLAEATLNLFT